VAFALELVCYDRFHSQLEICFPSQTLVKPFFQLRLQLADRLEGGSHEDS
jgi:hypothetical protein